VLHQAWLDDRRVAVGTKCNTLLTVDILDMTVAEVPLRRPAGRLSSSSEGGHCGIHCMELSPGGDMLATGGADPADCTVLRAATMQPVQTLVVSHQEEQTTVVSIHVCFTVLGPTPASG